MGFPEVDLVVWGLLVLAYASVFVTHVFMLPCVLLEVDLTVLRFLFSFVQTLHPKKKLDRQTRRVATSHRML